MGKRWSGNRWLAAAWALWGFSLVSTFTAMIVWLFGVSPDDFETTNFSAVLSQRQLTLAGALLMPGLSAAAAMRSILVSPRPPSRVIASVLVLLLAAAVFWFCCSWGLSAIDHASRTAHVTANAFIWHNSAPFGAPDVLRP
jgi:uncharacterized membrane protein